MKKTVNGVRLNCIIGLCLMFLGQWISKWEAFEDQDFLCGALLGAAVVLMIQAMWSVGRSVARSKTEK